jgi:hypothetical protein
MPDVTPNGWQVGIDIDGTFTDLVALLLRGQLAGPTLAIDAALA